MADVRELELAYAEISRLRDATAKAEADVQAIRTKLHSAVRKGKAIETERAALQVKLDAAQKQESSDTDGKLGRELEGLRHEVEALRKKERRAAEDAESLRDLKAAYQLASSELRALRQESEEGRRNAAANQEAADLLRQLQQHKQNSTETEARAETEIGYLQSRIEQLEAELANSFDTAQESRERSSKLEAKLNTVWQRCQELEEEAAERDMAQNRRSADSEDSHTSTHTHENGSAASAQILHLERDLAEAHGIEERLQAQLSRAEAEANSVSEDYRQNEGKLQGQLANAHSELEMSRQNADVMREALQAAAVKIQEAQASEAEAVASAESKDEEAAVLRKRVAECEGLLSMQQELESELERVREDLSSARDDAESSGLQLRTAEAESNAASRRVKELEQQLLEALNTEADRAQAAEQLRDAAAEEAAQVRSAAQRELEEARAVRQVAEDEARAAKQVNKRAQSAVEAAESRAKRAEEAAELLRSEEAARKQRFGLLHSTFAKEKQALQQELASANQQKQAQEAQLGEQNLALSQAKKESATAQTASNRLQASLEAAERHIGELEAMLRDSNAEASALEAQSSAEEASKRAEDAERRLEEAAKEKAHTVAEQTALECRLAEALERNSATERQLQMAQKELDVLKQSKATEELPNGNGTLGGLYRAELAEQGESGSRADENKEDVKALEAELARYKQKANSADKRVAAAGAVQHAKIASLEKQNQELHWQVAMLARDPEAPAVRQKPAQQQGAVQEPSGSGNHLVPKTVGVLLRYRRGLLTGYLAALHVLLYILLQARGHASTTCTPMAENLDPAIVL